MATLFAAVGCSASVSDKTCVKNGPAADLCADDSSGSDPTTGSSSSSSSGGGYGNGDPRDAGDAGSDGSDDASPGTGEFIEGTFGGVDLTLTYAMSGIDRDNGNIDITATSTEFTQYPRINLAFAPALGTTTCAAGLAPHVDYVASDVEDFVAAGALAGSTCSILITEIGPVGGIIRGNFTATMKPYNDGGGGGVTVEAAGTFNVVRRE